MEHIKHEQDILRRLEQSRNAVKQKYEILKRDKASMDRFIKRTFKPVSDPLEKLVSLTKNHSEPQKEQNTVKREVKSEDTSLDNIKKNLNNDYDGFDSDDSTETVIANNDDELSNVGNEEILKTVVDNISMDGKDVDKLFGVKKIGDELFLGTTKVNIDDKIHVGGLKFDKTNGLMELLYKKAPNDELITSADKNAYRDILNLTNIHKNKRGEIYKYDSNKLRKFILPLVESEISGAGILPRFKVARAYPTITDYVYWNDPNELVDRLRLLIAEQSAGNNAHINEIHSIIEELREDGYIY